MIDDKKTTNTELDQNKDENVSFYADFSHAKQLIKNKNYENSMSILNNISENIPNFYKTDYCKGMINYYKNELDTAEECWNKAWEKEWQK